MDLPTRLDLLALARNYIRTRATKIDPNQVDVIGSDVNLIVGSNMVVAYELVNQLAAAINRLLVDGAEEEDLDRLAWDRFGKELTRKAASPGITDVNFSRLTITAGAGSVPVGTLLQNDVGVQFVTTSQATFGASTLQATAEVRSVQAGKLNSSAVGTINRIVNIGTLWDPSLRVTNPVATRYASDRETDESFRNRIKGFWGTARRATLSAIEQGALSFDGIASALAVEELTANSTPARVVQMYVADEDGNGGTGSGINLDDYRAAGIQVILRYGMPQLVPIKLQLDFLAGKETQMLKESIRTAILGTVNQCVVNGWLYRAALLETLKSFVNDGLRPTDASIVEPVGDLIPDIGKTIRTTLDLVEIL